MPLLAYELIGVPDGADKREIFVRAGTQRRAIE